MESIALTYALIDLPMTIFRPLAALITALVAGLATEVFGTSDEKSESEEDSSGQCSVDLNGQKRSASFKAALF